MQWEDFLREQLKKTYFRKMFEFLDQAYEKKEVLPSKRRVFRAFRETPFQKTKVVILGQDPYPTPRYPNGLAFSTNPNIKKLPASLRNIYQELSNDLDVERPKNGDLSSWARQGVLLLNTSLTVEARKPASHSKIGWKYLTDEAIRTLSFEKKDVIFLLWGNKAKEKRVLIDEKKHTVLTASHPSPLSAHSGFFGCGHFSKVNMHLEALGKRPIRWSGQK